MEKKIVKHFQNGKLCFVCGTENDAGIHADYYLTDDGMIIGLATPGVLHQSYPYTVHGGVSAALLDDGMGRAIKSVEPERWGVTVELTTVYKHPVPYDEPLFMTATLTSDGEKIYTSYGEIVLEDGTVAVTATGKFFKMSMERLNAAGADESCLDEYDDNFPEYINIPEKLVSVKKQ